MTSNELFLWLFLTILELVLIFPIILRMIKLQSFSESKNRFPDKNTRKLEKKDKASN
ncbi:hypothetical protein [Domibacillus indicus]|uniref:hypothetical protein n=1 Tax=Domibacillus indicus TaxID=1437523 RepID=UPI00203B082D|nr:hypothetical protein [Domibacillus indicus]